MKVLLRKSPSPGLKKLLLTGLILYPFIASYSQSTPQVMIQKISDALEGGTNGKYRVALHYPLPAPENIVITFSYLGTATPPIATPGGDFLLSGLSGGNIVIPAGATETIIEVDATNDGIIEGPETTGIQLNSAVSASQTYTITPALSSASVSVIDANAASSTPLQVITGSNGTEPATPGTFTVKLAGVATSAWPVRVGYFLSGTTTRGADYTMQDMVTIPANTNSVQVTLTTVDDHVIEPTETITFNLLSGSTTDGGGNAFIFPPDPANNDVTVNLADNDNLPANRILSIIKTADAGEPDTAGNFRINLPADYVSSASLPPAYTLTGTAIVNTDYTINPVILPAYRNFVDVPVAVSDDVLIEPAETLSFNLSASSDGNGSVYTPAAVAGSAVMNLTDNDAILPLRLLSFGGNVMTNGDIALKWETADERNTDHFEVERSDDGSRFEAIGKVQAAGFGDHAYRFTDRQAGKNNFYRLRMKDKDGQTTLSTVLNLQMENNVEPVTVHPNPAKHQITLTVGDPRLLHTKALLTDVLGQIRQVIDITDQSQVIYLKNHAAGFYFLKMANGNAIRVVLK